MTARLLPGQPVADAVFADVAERAAKLAAGGHRPSLGTVLVGDDSASAGYIRVKQQKAAELGFESPHVHLPSSASQADLEAAIEAWNHDPAVDAMLVQHPTPPQIDYEAAMVRLDPDKDVDGLHPLNMGRLAIGLPGPVPCTPAGIEALLAFHGIPVSGREVVILGRGTTLGRPLALLLSQKRPTANAAVTVVHTGVPDWPRYTRRADVVVAAAGVPGILRPEHVSPGAVVVGGGVRYEGRRLLPDVDESVAEVAGAVTPRVGGVGPTTVAMLFRNAVEAAERRVGAGRTYSFEFFPPKTDEAERQLEKALTELKPLGPSFVSVTYGAGGSTRERTRDIVLRIQNDMGMTAMAHLTCAGHTRREIADIVAGYGAHGIDNILALAGDPPAAPDGGPEAPAGDFRYALELVELIRSRGDFSIGVAAHPELHPRSGGDRARDRDHLAAKLRRADFGVTQFFFRAPDYLAMVDDLAARGVDAPVVPGIMPVTNAGQVQRFAQLAGAEFPPDLAARIQAVSDRPEEVRRIGVEVATALCQVLLDAGAPGLHFYTLNRSTATREIYANLGLGTPG